MRYIADLHIHSPFSRATSKTGDLRGLAAWAAIKGIQLIGTGDFTHPGWFAQLKEQLTPAEPGLFRLKNQTLPQAIPGVTPTAGQARFLLSAEISSIYKRHGAVRKVHNLLFVPDFTAAERINRVLAGIGNIESDGRPILGLDSRDLLEILLEKAPEGFLVPAHIWTPWFSLFGSRSGFNHIEECYGDLSPHVFALETGLSSDPDMNRLIPALDRFALISNSDCHSPTKLGREANIFTTALSFTGLREALKNPLSGAFAGTVEFYPEEGKYHCDGHRDCGVCLEPVETRKAGGLCPVCGKPLTVGVLHRVMELAGRTAPYYPPGSPKVHSLIPLPEILAEICGVGPASKGVLALYARVISRFGSEFALLLDTELAEICEFSPVLGEAIARMREGRVIRTPGYDGQFGVIRVFGEGEREKLAGQISLFTGKPSRPARKRPEPGPLPPSAKPGLPTDNLPPPKGANPEQHAAITARDRHLLVSAGPGTGKTFTLVERIRHLLRTEHPSPTEMVAITFTNRAAGELKKRLAQECGEAAGEIFIGTFHAWCLAMLRRETPSLLVVAEEGRDLYLRKTFPEMSKAELHIVKKQLADHLDRLNRGTIATGEPVPDLLARYFASLEVGEAVDLDLVIPWCVERLERDAALAGQAISHLFVDEFQDLNHPQYRLVILLASQARVFAIGDPNQAIYGFRGSDLSLFNRFSLLPEVGMLSLIRNYRSAPAIIAGATAMIRRNRQSGGAELIAEKTDGALIAWHKATDAGAEAEFIANRIEEEVGGLSSLSRKTTIGQVRSFADFAVLYRLNQLAGPLTEALHRRGIPYQLVGATPFYLKAPIKSAGLFCLAAADATLGTHLALLAELPGIGEGTIQCLEKALPLHCPDFYAQAAKLLLPAQAAASIRKVGATMNEFRQAAAQDIAAALLPVMAELDLGPDGAQGLEARRLLQLAGAFGRDLEAFCEHLKQNAQATIYDARAEAVSLMTMHAAKGLEFPVVFLSGVEEEIIPCTIAGQHGELEEERRLFYVAMTRAEDRLIITRAATRTIFNRTTSQQPSRFLAEIPTGLLAEEVDRHEKKPRRTSGKQLPLF